MRVLHGRMMRSAHFELGVIRLKHCRDKSMVLLYFGELRDKETAGIILRGMMPAVSLCFSAYMKLYYNISEEARRAPYKIDGLPIVL